MLDANYARHLKPLGKIVHLYDTAGAAKSTVETNAARLVDQLATGEQPSWPGIVVLSPHVQSIQSSINNGQAAQQSAAISMATAYLTSDDFRNDLDTAPGIPSDAASVIDAWIADMTADTKTFTTESSAGLVNFFKQIHPTADFPQDAAPTHPDATYVTATII